MGRREEGGGEGSAAFDDKRKAWIFSGTPIRSSRLVSWEKCDGLTQNARNSRPIDYLLTFHLPRPTMEVDLHHGIIQMSDMVDTGNVT